MAAYGTGDEPGSTWLGEGLHALPESFDHPVIGPMDAGGAVCMDRDRPFRPGQRHATRPPGVAGGIPVTAVACLSCGYSPVRS